MSERILMLNDIALVRDFVSKTMLQNFDVELSSGKFTVDAKSIMGIFSLDLTKPVRMTAHCEETDPFLAYCESFVHNGK